MSSPCMQNPRSRSRIGDSRIMILCCGPQGYCLASAIMWDGLQCSTRPPLIHGRPAARRPLRARVVNQDVVVVNVRDGPADVPVDPERHDPEHERLHVKHDVPADHALVRPGKQKQAWRLHGAAGDNDPFGLLDRGVRQPRRSTRPRSPGRY